MGFLAFNENYYLGKLSALEKDNLSPEEVYDAKQHLKVLDDLADEGYTDICNELESKHQIITRFRNIISKYGETPFPMGYIRLPEVNYSFEEFELESLCDKLIESATDKKIDCDNSILDEIRSYSKWIGYEENTAYIFLFRDALLPYFYFKGKGRKNLYPLLISRPFLAAMAEVKNVDDEIRAPIYEALENGITDFEEFKSFCREKILNILNSYPKLKSVLTELLNTIPEKKIVVVESGYYGTIPNLLASLDDRVDFRLYTTAPFLYNLYSEKIFCRRYENIRLFETLYSQDIYMKYTSFRKGKFFVQIAKDKNVKEQSLGEIYQLLK